MEAAVITFPKARKPRRETKVGIAERILPKVFGVLRSNQVFAYGGSAPNYPLQNIVQVERDGYRLSASHLPGHSQRGGPVAEVGVTRGDELILDVWIYDRAAYPTNQLYDGRG